MHVDELPQMTEIDSPIIEFPEVDRLRTDSLAASMVMLLGLTAAQRLVGFLRGILFCRWLDAEKLGQWDMAFGFLILAAPLAVFGLPGSFGRYVEYYRQRGQLRPFLRRTAGWIALLAAAAVLAVAGARSWFSDLAFGSAEYGNLMLLLAVGLGVLIVDNCFTSLYTALRQIKFVSLMQFTNSLLFAVLGMGLLLTWKAETASIVVAFVASYCITATISIAWWHRIRRTLPRTSAALPPRSMRTRVLPFAFGLWIVNLLSNLSGIADRFMIVHFSGLPAAGALNMVGQYHTARIFPVLFFGVAELLGAIMTPHLSADWEAGQRAKVSQRLVLTIKVFGVGLVAAAIVVLLIAPVLFGLVWQNRYAGGLAVLPWALMCSVWAGLAAISYNYLWCAEKPHLVCWTLLASLAINVGLNLLLLSPLGLMGAALSATIARGASLALLWWLSSRLGMRVDRGLVVVAALPLALCLGPWAALFVLAVVLLEGIPGIRCLNPQEKQQVARTIADLWRKLKRLKGAAKTPLTLGSVKQ